MFLLEALSNMEFETYSWFRLYCLEVLAHTARVLVVLVCGVWWVVCGVWCVVCSVCVCACVVGRGVEEELRSSLLQ